MAADRGLPRRPRRAGQAGRHLHGAGLQRPAGLPVPRRRANRAPRLQGAARAARRGAGLEGLCPQPDRLLAALLARALPDPAHPGHPAVQPQGFHSGPWDLSFNTASSFVTNTNWQYYGGETTLTYFAQMAGLAVQNFVSAAVGIAVVVALIRGIVARSGARDRQLLAGPGPHPALHPAAGLDPRRALPRLPGRDPEPRRLHRDPHPGRRHARPWPRARSPRRR